MSTVSMQQHQQREGSPRPRAGVPVGRRDGECGSVGGYVCVCGRVGGCAGIQANTEGVGVRRRAAGWKPRETDGSVQQLLGSLAGGWWKGKESDLEVRLAISPGVVLESAAGVAASVRSGSYRVVTVPTVRHAAHLPLWADRAVLLGHFQSCPATNSPSCGPVLSGTDWTDRLCMCSSLWIPVWPVVDIVDTPRCARWHSVPGQPLGHRPRHRYCAVGDLHWV